jgi:alpha-L-fucosidase
VDLYFASVGRGASLLLNLPPDRRGRIHQSDVKALGDFGRLLAETSLQQGALQSGTQIVTQHLIDAPG